MQECDCQELFFLHNQCGKDECAHYWPNEKSGHGTCENTISSHFGRTLLADHYAPVVDTEEECNGEIVEVEFMDGLVVTVMYECYETPDNMEDDA